MKPIFKTLPLLCVFGFLSGCSAMYYRMGDALTPVEDLLAYDTSLSGKVFSFDGSLVGDYSLERSGEFSVEELPSHVRDAFLAAEDKLFYEHDGVDLVSLAGAAVGNFSRAQAGRRLAGASTITMQVAKNLMLTDVRGIERKIAEVIQSLQLEAISEKDRILEIYLSDVFFGERSRGIASAANAYFAKSPLDLTIEESAMLASLPKSPVQYNPYRFPDEALERRNWVIGQMAENEYITDEAAEIAIATPITLQRGSFERNLSDPYFTDEVRRSLDNVLGEGGFAQSGYSVVSTMDPELQALAGRSLRQGLIDYDRRYGWRGALAHISDFVGPSAQQNIAFGFSGDIEFDSVSSPENFVLSPIHQLAFNDVEIPTALHDWHLGLVTSVEAEAASIRLQDDTLGQIILDGLEWARPVDADGNMGRRPRSMETLLNVGDLIAVSQRDGSETLFNLEQVPAVNGGLVAMEPRSGRVLAIAGGWDSNQSQFNRATQAQRQPGSTFKPVVYLAALEAGISPNTPVSDDRVRLDLGDGEFFAPKNSDDSYSYARPMHQGLERSRNMMTLHLIGEVGISAVEDYAQLTHMNTNLRREFAAALGTAETTVLRVATAYSTIANGGFFVRPRMVDSVTDRFGRVLFDAAEENCYRQSCLDLRWFSKPPGLRNDQTFAIADSRRVWQLTAMLRGVVARGTGRRVGRALDFDLAGKTGTTNDVKDAWFVGFTPSLVVATFVGFDNPRSLGDGEQGASVAAPIVADFFSQVPDEYQAPFRRPENLGRNVGVGNNGLILTSNSSSGRIEGFGSRNIAEQISAPSRSTESSSGSSSSNSGSARSPSGGSSSSGGGSSSGSFGDVY